MAHLKLKVSLDKMQKADKREGSCENVALMVGTHEF